MKPPAPESAGSIIERAYREDLGDTGDITSRATIPEDHQSTANFVARAKGCVAGVSIIEMCLTHIDPTITCTQVVHDGEMVEPDTVVLTAVGSTRSLLAAERVALNLFGHLSGVATATRAFIDAVQGTGARISDTRKTTPGLRALEKQAVLAGGGVNHRMGLYDAVLIKDNHLVASRSLADAVSAARAMVGPDTIVEVEVDTLDQVAQAINTDADIVLFDNMDLNDLRVAVRTVGGTKRTEASGGITLDNVREIAETGVDVISVGWLTHSAPALDVAMDLSVREGE